MNTHVAYWQHEMAQRPVVMVWLLVWFITAAMNFSMGLETGGGGIESLFFASAFFGFAAAGAYAAAEQAHASGARRFGLWLLIGAQLALGQMAGWQVLGLSLSKGTAILEGEAAQRGTLDDRIKGLRAERAALGVARPVPTIEAEASLECKKVSKQYPDGIGPNCTKLKAELSNAQRALDIDLKLVPELLTQQAHGPQIKDANAHYQVPATFASAIATRMRGEAVAVTPDDVRFGWMVFLVLFLECVATLGPWLFQVGGHDRKPSDEPFNASILPPQYRTTALPSPASFSGPDYALPDPRPVPGGGNGATNIINVGQGHGSLPPRIAAARRARA
jgi:hypothetical protein